MAIITLTSDWGLRDHYVGAVKGAIYSQYPDAKIVDITHNIPVFDLEPASFVIRNTYINYPKGSIHIIAVNSEATIETPHTAILYDGHYFIGSDNGIFSLIFDKAPEMIIELNIMQDSDYFTFPTRDVFVKAACLLAKGEKLENLGVERKTLTTLFHIAPVMDNDSIKGSVIYIDGYDNVITNISEKLFKEIGKGRPYTISFRGYDIDMLSKSYKDVEPGEKLALFGTSGQLEIAISQGNASGLLGLNLKESVRIDFEEQ